MARKKLYIPEEVKEKIRIHLNTKYPLALEGYFCSNEDEDTITGDLFANLRIKNQKVNVKQDEVKGVYTWSISYSKFRGRGINATENCIGADGIIELEITRGNRKERKSILFQSKQDWVSDSRLLEQCVLLSTWREASFVLNYTPYEYLAYDIDSVIASRGKNTKILDAKNIVDFLGYNFLNCEVGDTDLRYDAINRHLKWRTVDGISVATKFSIPNRLKVSIKAPIFDGDYKHIKLVDNNDVHNYRMDASESEMLSLPYNHSIDEVKKAKRKMALIYHPDKTNFLDDLHKEIFNRRMQEINKASEILINKNVT